MFDFSLFNQTIDRLDSQKAIELLADDDAKRLPVPIFNYLLGLVSITLGKTAQGYNLIVKAANSDIGEKMIIEAAAALSARIGRLPDSVYYAKLSSASDVGLITNIPRMIGNFETHFQSIQHDPFNKQANFNRKKGNFSEALKHYENAAMFNQDDVKNWEGLCYCADQKHYHHQALQAALPLFELTTNSDERDFALRILTEQKAWDKISKLDFTKLTDKQADYLQDQLKIHLRIENYLANIPKAPLNKPKRQIVSKLLRQKLNDFSGDDYLNYQKKRIAKKKIKSKRLLVYCDLSSNHAEAIFVLDLIAELRNMGAAVVIFNDGNEFETSVQTYAGCYDDWINIENIDSVTLTHMVKMVDPNVIINLKSSIGHFGRSDFLTSDFKTHFPNTSMRFLAPQFSWQEPLFNSSNQLSSCLIPPRFMILNHEKFTETITDTKRNLTKKTLVLPSSIAILSPEFIEQFLPLRQNHELVISTQIINSDPSVSKESILLESELATREQLQQITLRTPSKQDLCFCLDLWGQEHLFHHYLNGGIVPALLTLPVKHTKKRRYGIMQELFINFGLESRIVDHINQLWSLPPWTEKDTERLIERYTRLSNRSWRRGAALCFANMINEL